MSTKRLGDFLAIVWVSGLGSGFIPQLLRLPGVGGATWGSFAALLIVLGIVKFLPFPFPAFLLLGLSLLHFLGAAYLIEPVERLLGPRPDPRGRIRTHDQNQIVLDEWLAVFILSTGIVFGFTYFTFVFDNSLLPAALLTATVIFRAIDIAKPWPLSQLEKLPGWKGVIADDVVAGLICIPLTLVLVRLISVF